MKFYGSTLAEGTNFKNFTVDVGTEFPETPNTGEIFCKSTQNDTALYVYLVDTWCKLAIETPTNDFEFVSETVVTNSIGEYELVLTNTNIEVFSINELVLNPTGPTFNKIVSIENNKLKGILYKQNALMTTNADGSVTLATDPFSPIPNFEFRLSVQYRKKPA